MITDLNAQNFAPLSDLQTIKPHLVTRATGCIDHFRPNNWPGATGEVLRFVKSSSWLSVAMGNKYW